MTPFIYRCPNTGLRVQGLAPGENEPKKVEDSFISITCLACGGLHLVNPKTGKMAGESGE
jgi:hypothetical protein